MSFNWTKPFSHSGVHSNFEPFRNRCRKGAAMAAMLVMTHSEKLAMLKKHIKDLTVGDRGKLVTTSVFFGCICRPSTEIM